MHISKLFVPGLFFSIVMMGFLCFSCVPKIQEPKGVTSPCCGTPQLETLIEPPFTWTPHSDSLRTQTGKDSAPPPWWQLVLLRISQLRFLDDTQMQRLLHIAEFFSEKESGHIRWESSSAPSDCNVSPPCCCEHKRLKGHLNQMGISCDPGRCCVPGPGPFFSFCTFCW